MRHSSVVLIAAAHLVALCSCSTAEKQEKERAQAWVKKLALSTLHYRRPLGASADPEAGPGGADYRSNPLPSKRFDCAPAKDLFKSMKVSEIRECLNGMASGTPDFILSFNLQKTETPELILRGEGKIKEGKAPRPWCVDELLARIPVPREIFYQGVRTDEEKRLSCFASGLPPAPPPKLGFRISGEDFEVTVGLPLSSPLRDDRDVELLLTSWVLKPYWDPVRHEFPAKVVPERVCQMCIGEENLVRITTPRTPLWPEESDAVQTLRGGGEDVPVGRPDVPEHTGVN